jgi:predicted acylesterase/phospholipase RssA
MALYIALLTLKMPNGAPGAEEGLWVPTAASVVLLLMLASWTLAGVAFFLDRYRWPVFTALLAVAVLTGSVRATDPQVPTVGGQSRYALATPGGVLGAFKRPIVVASAGGGIQAGAWAAQTLEGIDANLGGRLHERLALVSGVSGGSMGALYYGAFDGGALSEATRRSMAPSLDEIATALIGSDTLRLAGISAGLDRGAALERSWAQRLPASGDFSLRNWSERVARVAKQEAGVRAFPAFLFNTTVVETGQPMAFATTQFPTDAYRRTFVRHLEQYPVVESANGMFGLLDKEHALDVGLQAVTAARLSAAFPYVSPAATLEIPERPRHHLVDGGYYDNYGLAAVSQWLDDALTEMPARPTDIDILIVRGLVGSESDVERDLRGTEDERRLTVKASDVPNQGWLFQATAPPAAFLKTREFGQWAGGNQVLRLLKEKWRGTVNVHVHLFDYPVERLPETCRLAPLSWKLTLTQQGCIGKAWQIAAAEAFGRTEWQRVK